MAVWNNDDLVLCHGCTEQSLLGANPNGIAVGTLPHRISLRAGGRRTEFGRGFYATSRIDQAKNWAHVQARKLAAKSLSKTTPKAVVLRFDVSRDKLADLEALVFTNENCGFWPFVTYCRSGSVPHGRSTGRCAPQHASIATTQRRRLVTKLPSALRRIRRLKTTSVQTSKAARVLAKINPNDNDVHRPVPSLSNQSRS